MGLLEELVPNAWERQRLIMRLVVGGLLLLVVVWLLLLPSCRARGRVRQTQRDLNAVAQQVKNWQQSHGGTLPRHKPMARTAKLRADIAEQGGEGLTTFDPLQFAPRQLDRFSAGDGTQPFIYFASNNPPLRWLLASEGPDGHYQLKLNSLVDFARNGNAVLVPLSYDPTNGTRSAGDIIITGP